MVKKQNRLEPINPGEILREDFLEPMGISINQLPRSGRVQRKACGLQNYGKFYPLFRNARLSPLHPFYCKRVNDIMRIDYEN